MTIFEYINNNRELTLRMSELGLMKYKVELYYAIYSRYLYYVQRGNSKTRAIKMSCEDHNTCEQTGWLVVKQMEKKI